MTENKLKIETKVSLKRRIGGKIRGTVYGYTPYGTYIILADDGNLYESVTRPPKDKKEHNLNAHFF